MDEYQISDLIASNASILYMNSGDFATLVSAYIAMAYFVGNKLSLFQVSFINFVFIGITVTGSLAAIQYSSVVMELTAQLQGLDSDLAHSVSGSKSLVNVYFIFRFMVIAGCVIFMWQSRRGLQFSKNT